MRSLLVLNAGSLEQIEAAVDSGPDAILISVNGLAAIRGRTIEPRVYVRLAPFENPDGLGDLLLPSQQALMGSRYLGPEAAPMYSG